MKTNTKNHTGKTLIQTVGVWIVLALLLCVAPAEALPVMDWVPPGGYIVFWWTKDGAALTDPQQRNNNTNEWKLENFGNPPAEATDWRQWTEDKNGKRSDVMGGNIKKDSPWSWHLLSELPSVYWQIPDLISPGPIFQTLYAAVNLDLYLNSNPWPDLSPGQTLTISGGQLSGLQGMYWGTTEFTFDPNSSTGFVPVGGTWFNGDAVVQNFHTNVPEPGALLLLGSGLAGAIGFARKRLFKKA